MNFNIHYHGFKDEEYGNQEDTQIGIFLNKKFQSEIQFN